jgi:Xaa-Pro dipeptidase
MQLQWHAREEYQIQWEKRQINHVYAMILLFYHTPIFEEVPMADRSDVPSYPTRQKRLAEVLQAANLDAMALNPGPSLTYLTGLHFHLMERPVIALFTPHEAPLLVMPELEAAKTTALSYPIKTCLYGENPDTWAGVYVQALSGLQLKPASRIGVETRRMRLLEYYLLEGAAPDAVFVPSEDQLAELRMVKDPQEILAMRKAVDIAQLALLATLPSIHTGMTETELAAELTLQLLRSGSDSSLPFEPIVSAGPNSANPHATPSQRRLESGDLLVIDWGAAYAGYLSDLTRTFAISDPSPEFLRMANIVEEANAAGRMAARPGVPASTVDAAARGVIDKSGYGKFFIHRTGHGLGMEVHEEPYIRGDNNQLLKPGMTFTIEPGIYLPERGGVRIEDNVVITISGSDSLSDLPRELKVVG